jgi:hypothetical protein
MITLSPFITEVPAVTKSNEILNAVQELSISGGALGVALSAASLLSNELLSVTIRDCQPQIQTVLFRDARNLIPHGSHECPTRQLATVAHGPFGTSGKSDWPWYNSVTSCPTGCDKTDLINFVRHSRRCTIASIPPTYLVLRCGKVWRCLIASWWSMRWAHGQEPETNALKSPRELRFVRKFNSNYACPCQIVRK